MKEILALEQKSSNWIQCNKISIADLKILTAKVIFYTCSVEQISLQFVEVYFFSSGTKVAQKGFVSQICVLQALDNVFLWLAVYFGVMHVSPAASWSPPYPSISSLIYQTPTVIFLYCSTLIHMEIQTLECFVYLGPSSFLSGCLTNVGP